MPVISGAGVVKKPILDTDSSPVCKFYLKNECRYAASGRKGGRCPFKHPTKCQTLMRYGVYSKNNTKGCQKSKCEEFHPKLCYESMKSRECSRKECKFSHIRNTKRTWKDQVKTPFHNHDTQSRGQSLHQGGAHGRMSESRGHSEGPISRPGPESTTQQGQGSFLDPLEEILQRMRGFDAWRAQVDMRLASQGNQALIQQGPLWPRSQAIQ